MKTDFLQAIIYIVIVICVPIFVFGAVLALISIDKYIQKIEKHLKTIAENTADMQLNIARADNDTADDKNGSPNDETCEGKVQNDEPKAERTIDAENRSSSDEDNNGEPVNYTALVVYGVIMLLSIIILAVQSGLNS